MATPNWVTLSPTIGVQPIDAADTVQNHGLGTILQARHATYGGGQFVYLAGVASLAAGDWVTFNDYTGATARWAGTANSGSPLAVAVAAVGAGQYGWFQVVGSAVANVSGTVAAGDKVFWQATATTSSSAVNGKQVMNAVAASANGVPAAGKAVFTIEHPGCQGQTV